MDNGDNDIKLYTAEDITRYWQGKLTPQEMHAMELAAMDDPFLADALEGYSNANAATVSAEVRELHTRLNERTSRSKVVPLRKRWWAVAALFVLLCGFGALTYNLFIQNNNTNKNPTVALRQADSPVVAAKDKDTLAAVSASQDTGRTLTFANSDSTLNNSYAAVDGQCAKESSISAYRYQSQNPAGENYGLAATAPKAKSVIDSLQVIAKSNDNDDAGKTRRGEEVFKNEAKRYDNSNIAQNDSRSRNSPSESIQGRAAGVQVQRNSPNNQGITAPVARDNEAERLTFNSFSGRVLGRNNEPIPYATVRANNAALTATDQNGYFNFRSFDTVLNLSATSVGFEPKQFTLKTSQPVDVVLDQTDKKLSEVVVTGYPSQKKRDVTGSVATLKVFVMDAAPVVGWDDYNKYIETNRRIAPMGYKVDRNQRLDSANAPVKG